MAFAQAVIAEKGVWHGEFRPIPANLAQGTLPFPSAPTPVHLGFSGRNYLSTSRRLRALAFLISALELGAQALEVDAPRFPSGPTIRRETLLHVTVPADGFKHFGGRELTARKGTFGVDWDAPY